MIGDSARTVGRDLGRMIQALAGMMGISVLVAVIWLEWFSAVSFLLSGAITLSIGSGLRWYCQGASDPGRLHGMVIAAAGWFCIALLGALPFLSTAWIVSFDPGFLGIPEAASTGTLLAFRNPLNALFESMSGFTGTGLTMAVHEPRLPRTIQWWRSFIEWVGGVGVIVLTTAVLARPGSGSLTLYESEARSEKIHPSIVSTVRTIWWIFLLFTAVAVAVLWAVGMPFWDALNHAMTGLATGGFSVTDNSIGTYDSPLIEFALVPIMIAGSIAFPIHYLVLQGDLRKLYTDLQTRWVFGFFAIGTAALVATLASNGTYANTGPVTFLGVTLTGSAATWFQSFRYGLFQFVSAASCTGFQTAGSLGSTWLPESQLIVSLGMIVGAAAGSTVGGIKLIRVLTLVKGTAFRIRGIFYPDSAMRMFELDNRVLREGEASREFEEAAIIAVLWVAFLLVGIFTLLSVVPTGPDAFTLENVVFEVASAQGNVGLSSGITGPEMPTAAKLVFLFNMWIGRLEIIPVLVLLRGLLTGLSVYD